MSSAGNGTVALLLGKRDREDLTLSPRLGRLGNGSRKVSLPDLIPESRKLLGWGWGKRLALELPVMVASFILPTFFGSFLFARSRLTYGNKSVFS